MKRWVITAIPLVVLVFGFQEQSHCETYLPTDIRRQLEELKSCPVEATPEKFHALLENVKGRPLLFPGVIAHLRGIIINEKAPQKRRYAAITLFQIDDIHVIEPLSIALNDPDFGTRWIALFSMAHIRDWRVVQPLVSLLKDKNQLIQDYAYAALREITQQDIGKDAAQGAQWFERNKGRLKDLYFRADAAKKIPSVQDIVKIAQCLAAVEVPDQQKRVTAIRQLETLAENGNAAVAAELMIPLISLLKDDNSRVRQEAAVLLGNIRDDQVTKSLVSALADKEPAVRAAALLSLGSQLDNMRGDASVNLKFGDFKDLPAVEAILRMLSDKDERIRQTTLLVLDKFKDKTLVEPLIPMLADKHKEVRETAVKMLGQLQDERAVQPLIPLLQDKEISVREAVIAALGELKASSAVEPLMAIAKDESNQLRRQAIQTLSKIQDPRIAEFLRTLLNDKDPQIREAATAALLPLGDAAAVDQLIVSFARRGTTYQRGSTVKALRNMGEPAVDKLLAALTDHNSDIRAGAARVLGEMKDVRAVQPLIDLLSDEVAFARDAAVDALGKIKDRRAVKHLIVVLSEGIQSRDLNSHASAQAAARALAQIRDPEAIPPLLHALLYSKYRVAMRSAAEALKEIDAGQATDKITEAIRKKESDEIVERALQGLSYLGDPAVAPLTALLKSPDGKTRKHALSALRYMLSAQRLGEGDQHIVDALLDFFPREEARAFSLEGQWEILLWINHDPRAVELIPIMFIASNGECPYGGTHAPYSPSFVTGLCKVLSHEDVRVRRGASAALINSYSSEAVEPLISACNDTDEIVRHNAVKVLARVLEYQHDARVVLPLIKVFSNQEETTKNRVAAIHAFDFMSRNQTENQHIEPLIHILKNKKEPAEVRHAAASPLGMSEDYRAAQALNQVHSDSTESEEMHNATRSIREVWQELIDLQRKQEQREKEQQEEENSASGTKEGPQKPLVYIPERR